MSACPDTKGAKPAGVPDGMEALARNGIERQSNNGTATASIRCGLFCYEEAQGKICRLSRVKRTFR